jgi:hypothetical protein
MDSPSTGADLFIAEGHACVCIYSEPLARLCMWARMNSHFCRIIVLPGVKIHVYNTSIIYESIRPRTRTRPRSHARTHTCLFTSQICIMCMHMDALVLSASEDRLSKRPSAKNSGCILSTFLTMCTALCMHQVGRAYTLEISFGRQVDTPRREKRERESLL